MRRGALHPACLAIPLLACACGEAPCGPTSARVAHAADGDSIVLDDGTRVRYLMVDAPEVGDTSPACHALESLRFNRALVEGRTVTLRYDQQCTDRYGRLLAYVRIGDREVNRLLVERGQACALHVPPNGSERVAEFFALEAEARRLALGLWGRCARRPCRR